MNVCSNSVPLGRRALHSHPQPSELEFDDFREIFCVCLTTPGRRCVTSSDFLCVSCSVGCASSVKREEKQLFLGDCFCCAFQGLN